MKNKIIVINLMVVFLIYVSSYVLIREYNTVSIEEREGCPCEYAYLPQGRFYFLYRPLIHLDMTINHRVVFIFTGWKP